MSGLIVIIICCGAAIAVAGTKLSASADRLADRTGLGEAFVGGVFLGAATSLPGITASVTAAIEHYPTIAVSNAIGGIAAQTAFLGVADIAYRRANLEHAAASVPNMMSGALLIVLLAVLLWGTLTPQLTIAWIHPSTFVLFGFYLFGLRLVYQSHEHPMWRPRITRYTKVDTPEQASEREPSLLKVWGEFIALAAIVVVAGFVLARTGIALSNEVGISETIVGALIVAIITSLPELVTSVAAVRQGALTLAVGGILGGNAFDTLFAGVADVAYLPGAIYQGAGSEEQLLMLLSIAMTAILLLGLLVRERKGLANIGFESVLVLIMYASALFVII